MTLPALSNSSNEHVVSVVYVRFSSKPELTKVNKPSYHSYSLNNLPNGCNSTKFLFKISENTTKSSARMLNIDMLINNIA